LAKFFQKGCGSGRKACRGDADLLNLLARIAQGMCSPFNATSVAKDVGLRVQQ